MKYIFAFKHYNYVRWLSLYVDDLLKLEYTFSDVYKEFCNWRFVMSKTKNQFSSIAIDQAKSRISCYKRSKKYCWVSLTEHGSSSTAVAINRAI